MSATAAALPGAQAPGATARLPWSQLLSVSVYWLGISALWGGYELFGQSRVEAFVGLETRGTVMGYLEFMGALVAVAVQPTIGTISDYTITRWGRRKPYILIGASFDLVFIYALINAQTLLAFAAFLLLLQLSSNFAQGPFQGYIPDLVPEKQVTIASGLLGLMRASGVITGYFIVSTGAATGDYGLPFLLIGVMEVSLAVLTVLLVREGPTGRQREGRSWFAIAREAWGTDVLRERNFLYMSATRLLFLMGPSAFINFSLFYVRDTLGQSGEDLEFWIRVGLASMVVGTLLGTLPGAKLSQRIGRKRVIWGAAAVASLGIVVVATAGSPTMAVPGLVLIGLGSGAYMSVDWALMTSVIPKIASGRYMGLANIANAISGPMAVVVAGRVLDYVTIASGAPTGSRAAVACGVLFLAGACLTLTRVHPPTPAPISGANPSTAPAGS